VNTGAWAKQTADNKGVATARSLDKGAADIARTIKVPRIISRIPYYANFEFDRMLANPVRDADCRQWPIADSLGN
jgi:hypothetical protein